MAISKTMTHQGEVVGVGPFKTTKPQVLQFRETKLYWISTSGARYVKVDGTLQQKGANLNTGTFQLRLKSLKKIKEGKK